MSIDNLLHHTFDIDVEIACGAVDLFYSNQIREELGLDSSETLDDQTISILDAYIDSQDFYSGYVEMYAELNNLRGVGILFAHGGVINPDLPSMKSWTYDDGIERIPVQRWIDANDGKYAALVLHSCNPGHCEVKSKSSILLPYGGMYSNVGHSMNAGSVDLVVPQKGYINSTELEGEFRELLSLLKSKQ